MNVKEKNGAWLPVVAADETDVIVISGDILQEYRHHYYQSATHRGKGESVLSIDLLPCRKQSLIFFYT